MRNRQICLNYNKVDPLFAFRSSVLITEFSFDIFTKVFKSCEMSAKFVQNLTKQLPRLRNRGIEILRDPSTNKVGYILIS